VLHLSVCCGLTNSIPRFIVREFVYNEEEIIKEQQDLEVARTTEKELWVRQVQNLVRHKLIHIPTRRSF